MPNSKKAAAKHKAQVASDEAVILASQLKKVELTIPVKVGEGGKVFGAITGKTISEAAKAQYDIDLDKKKVESRIRLNRSAITMSPSASIRRLPVSSKYTL